ncbi:class I SAM-dependent methyltransferase [Candidatus Thioglobus sp.]|nr:class I SAM-dependent methyltransferase [Candidatus Thioglobus sp.]
MQRDIDSYSKNYLENENSFEKYQVHYRRKNTLEQIQLYKHQHIVEVGCGMEPLFEYFDDFLSMTVIEPSDKFFRNAVEKSNKNLNVTLINELFENAQLNTKLIDFILVSSLLHEVPNVESFLFDIKSKCSEDTVIHINVPNSKSFHRLLGYKSGIINEPEEFSDNNRKFQINRIFNSLSLKNLVEKAGFEIINSGSYFVKPFTHQQMKLLLEQNIINEKALDGFYNMIEYLPDLGSEIYVNIKLKK